MAETVSVGLCSYVTCAKAHPQTHAFGSVITGFVFFLFHFRASREKHRQQQAHRDPRQRRVKKIQYSFYHQKLSLSLQEAALFQKQQPVTVFIVFGKIEIGAAPFRAVYDAPHGLSLFLPMFRFLIILLILRNAEMPRREEHTGSSREQDAAAGDVRADGNENARDAHESAGADEHPGSKMRILHSFFLRDRAI